MIVAEQHKIFTHHLHRQWPIAWQLFRERYRMPIASHKISTGSSGTGLRDLVVFFLRKHGIILDFRFWILDFLTRRCLLYHCPGAPTIRTWNGSDGHTKIK